MRSKFLKLLANHSLTGTEITDLILLNFWSYSLISKAPGCSWEYLGANPNETLEYCGQLGRVRSRKDDYHHPELSAWFSGQTFTLNPHGTMYAVFSFITGLAE